jgi:hypothetical protein
MSVKNEEWMNAKRKYRLTDVQIQMARELGMNPRKFGSLANHKQENWKAPLADFIEELYNKRFKKESQTSSKNRGEICACNSQRISSRRLQVKRLNLG